MIKAIYMHPKANVEHFKNVHVALTNRIPGIAHWTMNIGTQDPITGDAPPFQLVNELWFESEADLRRMLDSQELQEALKDVPNFNPDPSKVVVLFAQEEPVKRT